MVQILIQVNEITNQISVEGPIGNKILMLGVLEMVKNVVLSQKESPILVSPETRLKVVAEKSNNQQKEH
jgi:hypothetical protein